MESWTCARCNVVFFFQAEDGIRDSSVTGVQTCALPISRARETGARSPLRRRFIRNNRTISPGRARTGVFHSGRFSLPSIESGKSGESMTASMTAFARRETATPWGGLSWELRAVNHRYLELGLKLPDELRAIEPAVRELLGKRLG